MVKIRRLLLAGTRDAAQRYACNHNLSSQPRHWHEDADGNLTSWRHISHSHQLRGIEGPARNPETQNRLIFVGAPPRYLDPAFRPLARERGF